MQMQNDCTFADFCVFRIKSEKPVQTSWMNPEPKIHKNILNAIGLKNFRSNPDYFIKTLRNLCAFLYLFYRYNVLLSSKSKRWVIREDSLAVDKGWRCLLTSVEALLHLSSPAYNERAIACLLCHLLTILLQLSASLIP